MIAQEEYGMDATADFFYLAQFFKTNIFHIYPNGILREMQ